MSGTAGMERHRWTEAERARLAEVAPGRSHEEIREIMTAEFGDHFGGSRITAALKRYGIRTGRTGHFEKGHEPFNKGKSWDEFMPPESQERSRRTQYKPGDISGFALKHSHPVGYERVDGDGYTWVKVSDGLQDNPNSNYRQKHRVVYEQVHGSIPEGCNVVFADRDKTNLDPGNLVAVPRNLWTIVCKRGWAYHDAESLEVCVNLARLMSAVHSGSCAPRACRSCDEVFEPRFARQRTCDACLELKRRCT